MVLVSFVLILAGSQFLSKTVYSIKGKNREEWIQDGIRQLKDFKPSLRTTIAKYSDLDGGSYYVDDSQLIRFKSSNNASEGWFFFVMHSAHNDLEKRGSDSVVFNGPGDVILARDHLGKFYVNTAHVCGGIQLISGDKQEFQSQDDFIKSKVLDDDGSGSPWRTVAAP